MNSELKIIGYKQLVEKYPQAIVSKVKDSINFSWQPYGSPVWTGSYFIQTMVKYGYWDSDDLLYPHEEKEDQKPKGGQDKPQLSQVQ